MTGILDFMMETILCFSTQPLYNNETTPTKMQIWKQVSGCTELIEDVVISFIRCLKHHPGFL
jgi:hypothetical protein